MLKTKRISLILTVAMMALMVIPGAYAMDMDRSQETGQIIGGGPVTLVDGLWDDAVVVGTLPVGTSVIILQRFGDMVQVFARAERLIGWVKSDYVRVDQGAAPVYTGVVISQNVSIRRTPDTRGDLIVTAHNGDVVEILAEQSGWYTINYWDGKSTMPIQGYARTNFIVRDPAFITTTQATYVYAMPSSDSKMVGQLVSGTQLVVIGEWNEYWVVNLRSASGFIRKSDVGYNQIGGNG